MIGEEINQDPDASIESPNLIELEPHEKYADEDQELNDQSPRLKTIFETAHKAHARRKLGYAPLKDYSCIIYRKCPSGKTCITTSSGKEYVKTLSWDVPGNDIV